LPKIKEIFISPNLVVNEELVISDDALLVRSLVFHLKLIENNKTLFFLSIMDEK
jgi:hypothetical protein